MLLAQKPHAVEHLSRAHGGGVDALMKLRILRFELRNALLGVDIATAALRRDALQPRFGRMRPLAKCGEFLAQVSDERFEFLERLRVRPYGGRHRVLSPAP